MIPVLSIKGLVKDYPGVRAVDHADLELLPGEVHGLVGENGAGKSTLIKILAGVVRKDAGEISVGGRPVDIRFGEAAHRLGLSFIHQELNLIPYLNGAENIFLGYPYPKTIIGTVNWNRLHRDALHILEELGNPLPTDWPVVNLSRGDQAMIAIARAFAQESTIYVMDEPTASLSEQEVQNLFRVIRLLKSQGRTVLYVTHRLEEIFEIADRVTVMRNGAVVGTYRIAEITKAELIRQMIGKTVSDASFQPQPIKNDRPILSVQGLSGGRIRDISFTLYEGQILGLAGLVGSGRTEILQMIFGVAPVETGILYLDGHLFQPRSPGEAIQRGVIYMPEDRHLQGLVLSRSVLENITLPHLSIFARMRVFPNRREEKEVGRDVAKSVQLKARDLSQRVGELSGGNQQKVIFARWLVRSAKVLLMDEPTIGVDVGARFEIHRLIRQNAERGAAVILVSSDLNELLALADHLLVIRQGRLVTQLENRGLTPESVLRYCYGEEK